MPYTIISDTHYQEYIISIYIETAVGFFQTMVRTPDCTDWDDQECIVFSNQGHYTYEDALRVGEAFIDGCLRTR